MSSRNLILVEGTVPRFQFARPVNRPGVTTVGVTADNRIELIDRVGTISRHRLRYEIDTSDHHEGGLQFSLPSADDLHHFNTVVDLGWRVHNPVEVVKRQLQDGLTVVVSRLLDRMRVITRRHSTDAAAAAEQSLNQLLASGDFKIPEGMTVFRFSARLSLDLAIQQRLRQLGSLRHEDQIAEMRSRTVIGQVQHDTAVKRIQLEGELDRERRKLEAVRAALQGKNDLLMMFLAGNPNDSMAVMRMILDDRDASRQDRTRLLIELIDRQLIQDGDIDNIRQALTSEVANGLRSAGAVSDNFAALDAAAAIASNNASPGGGASQQVVIPHNAASGGSVIEESIQQRTNTPGLTAETPPVSGGASGSAANVARWKQIKPNKGPS